MPIPPTFPFAKSATVEPFDFYESLSIGVGLTASIDFTVSNPPEGFVVLTRAKLAWITLFGHGIDNVATFVDTIWRIRRNFIPVRFYDNIQDQLSEFTDPQEIGPIRLRADDRVEIQIVNNSASINLYAVRLRGFYDLGKS